MAAGQGFKTFTTGEVLSAADVNGYLMQGVLVFANSAERDSEITSPQEGQFAYLKDTNVTTYYTGSAWANLDTTGMTNPMTTTGDTIYSSSGSTPARLGIGTTGQVLTVAGGVPTWATAGGGGGSLTLAQIATGTLSGTSISITGLSSYDNLIVVFEAYQSSSGGNRAGIAINGNRSALYDYRLYNQRGSVTETYSVLSTNKFVTNDAYGADTTNNNRAVIVLENCKNAGFTRARSLSGVSTTGGKSLESWEGIYRNNIAVSSIELLADVAWTAGTYTIYGA